MASFSNLLNIDSFAAPSSPHDPVVTIIKRQDSLLDEHLVCSLWAHHRKFVLILFPSVPFPTHEARGRDGWPHGRVPKFFSARRQ
jgi:hypothetical protein